MRTWLWAFVCVVGLLAGSMANAGDTVSDYQYTDNGDGTVTITGYIGSGGDIAIPSELDGKAVTAIGDYAFYGCSSLSSVDIPEGVTSVGNSAFRGCAKLTTIDIPEGVTSIGDSAFYGCSSLSSVDIPEGVTSIGDSVFRDCANLTSVDIPEGVTSIGNSAFYSCGGLTSVKIPEGVTSIGDSAFYYCHGLTSVDIPKGVISIESNAFAACHGLTSVDIPKGVIIGYGAFYSCGSLTSVEISEGVTSIGNIAFYRCGSLRSVIFKGNVPTTFGVSVFNDTAKGFRIWYRSDSEGFTTPEWNGYPCFPLVSAGTLTMTVSPEAGGETTPAASSETQAYLNVPITIGVTPNAKYVFTGWTAEPTGNAVFANAAVSSTTVTLRDDATVTAKLIATHTVTFLAGANGELSGETSQTVLEGANCSSVTAIPVAGHHFVNWTLDGAEYSTANPLTVTDVASDLELTANFAINTFTLAYVAGNGGELEGETTQTVNYGGSGSVVTAVPATGYHFVNWSDDSTSNPRTDSNITTDIAVTANFAINTFTLAYAAGENGTLTGETNQTVNYGGNGTAVTAVPAIGYHFVNWNDGSTSNPRTDSDVTTDITVTANFAINTFTLAYTAGENGTLTGETNQTVNYGGNGTAVTAVPATGYHFVNWNDGSTTNPRTDSDVTADIAVMANFAINTFTLAYAAGENGTLTGETNQTVNYGGSGSVVTAVPATGYHFINWSDGSTANPRTDSDVTADIAVTANFAINTFTLAYAAGENGTLTGETNQTVNYGGNGTAVTAVPAIGYHFVNWNDGSTANPRTDSDVTTDITVTANFAINTFTLVYTAGENGTLTGETSQTVNYGGNGTAVTAVPATGYHFVNWNDGSTTNPRTDSDVTADIAVMANFAINTFTLAYAAGENGTLTGETNQTVNYGGNGTAVTAVPATGYHFVNWSDDLTSNPRTDSNITTDIAVTANFAINVYSVNFNASTGGDIDGKDSQNVEHGANCSAVTAVCAEGYEFTGWDNGFGAVNPLIVTNVTSNMTIIANFKLKSYAITVSVDAAMDSGMVDPGGKSDTVMVNHGANQTFTITPYSGCRIADVLVDGVSVGAVTSYSFLAVSAGHALNASFAPIASGEFVITATAGFGGTVTPSGETVVASGASVSVAITPDSGYVIKNVWVDGVSIGAVYNYKFTAISTDHALSASFSVSDGGQAVRMVNGNSVIISVTPPASGSTVWGCEELLPEGLTPENITGSNGAWNTTKRKITWNGEGNADVRLSYTVNGAAGTYVVSGGANFGGATATTGGDSSVILSSFHPADQGGDWAIVMQEAIGYVAGWQAGTNPMSYAARALYIWKNGEDYHFDGSLDRPSCWVVGSVSDTSLKSAAAGIAERGVNATTNAVTIKITPPAGALVWTCEEFLPEGLTAGTITGANRSYNDETRKISWYDFVVDTAPIELVYTVSGALGSYTLNDGSVAFDGTIVKTSPAATVVIDKQQFVIAPTAGLGGSISPDTTVTVDSGANCTFFMVSGTGYHITDVLADGASVGSVASYTFKNVTSNHTIAASFAIDTFTLTYNAGEHGSLSGEASQTVEYGASGSMVTAVPDVGYHFVSWSDGATANPRTDTNVTADIAVTASFAINVYTVTFAASEGGSVEGQTTQNVEHGATCSPVVAIREKSYDFSGWDNGFGAVNPLTVSNVTANMAITASFAKKAKPEYWVAQGSVFTVNASDLEAAAAFVKKPKIQAMNPANNKKGGMAKVLGFVKGAASVDCVWQGKDKPGTYALRVNDETLTSEFIVQNPADFDVALSSDTGAAGDKITVSGQYFGSKCPKVTMEFKDAKGKLKKMTCKVVTPYKFADANGKVGNSVMDVETGVSELVFTVPKGITETTPATLKLNCGGNMVEKTFNKQE